MTYIFVVSDDHSRVTLKPIEGYEHDYINGNFIDVRENLCIFPITVYIHLEQ